MNTATQQVLARLNSYAGDNIWEDVILRIDGYDEAATAELDPHSYSDRFVAGGVEYRYRRDTLGWVLA